MALGPVMLDIEGLALNPADRTVLREPAVGGVILFARNYKSPLQIADLVAEIKVVRSPPLLIAVDHEGGRVQRFRDGFTAIPPMRRLGHLYDEDEQAGTRLAESCGWLIGAELRAMGIDLSFAPCVDLDWGVSEIIGDRSFHKDPGIVATLASALSRGMRDAGMTAVAKHFPGHGAVVADSHKKLPVDRRGFSDVFDDMRPYENLISRREIGAVMMAHVIYDEIDAAPASFSSFWIKNHLRNQMGFDGAVFCDDLSMEAVASYGSMPQRAKIALEAGCDMIPICNDRPAAQRTVAALREYSNPLSLVRLARLHGTGGVLRESLLASEQWQSTTARLDQWLDRPALELNS